MLHRHLEPNLVQPSVTRLYIILGRRCLAFTSQGTHDPRRECMFARRFEIPWHRRSPPSTGYCVLNVESAFMELCMKSWVYISYHFPRNLVIITPDLLLYSLSPVYPITNTMMVIRTILPLTLALSLATYSLAVPVTVDQLPSLGEAVGAFCFQYAHCISLIDSL